MAAPTLRAACVALLFSIAACGGSATDTAVIGPSESRCAVAVQATRTSFSHDGGSASLDVATDRDCEWTAASEASWVAVRPGSGQGAATVTVSVAPNAQRTMRTGAVRVGGDRVEFHQNGVPPPPPPPPPASGSPTEPPSSPPPPDEPGKPQEPEQPETPEQPKPEQPKPEEPKPPKPEDPKPEEPKPPKPEEPEDDDEDDRDKDDGDKDDDDEDDDRDDDDDDEEDEDDKGDKDRTEKVDVEGPVSGLGGSCPSLSMRIRGTDVTTDGSTSFEKGSCADIRNGVKVEVKGERTGGGPVRARRVKMDR